MYSISSQSSIKSTFANYEDTKVRVKLFTIKFTNYLFWGTFDYNLAYSCCCVYCPIACYMD